MWDEKYSNAQFVYGTAPNDFLRENVHHFVPEGKILCIAEGEGRNAVWLAELGFKVTAGDASEVGLACEWAYRHRLCGTSDRVSIIEC